MSYTLSTIWGKLDCCVEHHRCATTLYLMSMLSHEFYVIIECGIIATGHGIELLYGLNAIEKRFLFQLMPTLKLLGAKGYYTHLVMHTGTRTSDINLDRE